MADRLLEASGLSWIAGGRRIIDGVSVGVDRGELLGVIGPNGAGKTTLLRLLCGLLQPAAGEILLEGAPIASMPPVERARRISFMRQDAPSSFPITVMEVLLMARYPWLGRFGRETAEDRERAGRMLAYVGLAGFEERAFPELSGGERQLVLFAQVLVQDTELIALDEPTGSLDIRHQDRVFSMARELAREGRAVVATVHDLEVASRWCTRLLLVGRGRVEASGPASEVIRSDRLDPVYGVRTLVSANPVAGGVSVSLLPERVGGAGLRVHLVGGAGSAVNVTRELLRLGCTVTGGIAHEHDSDEKLWRSLGIEYASVGAFSRIGDADVARAESLVELADLTVLCPFPVGPGNLGNLRLALQAKRLIVLEPGAADLPRTFFADEGRELFAELAGRGQRMGYEQLLDEVKASKVDRRAAGRRGR
jgi:iron complex transport system ATP-binding protein